MLEAVHGEPQGLVLHAFFLDVIGQPPDLTDEMQSRHFRALGRGKREKEETKEGETSAAACQEAQQASHANDGGIEQPNLAVGRHGLDGALQAFELV